MYQYQLTTSNLIVDVEENLTHGIRASNESGESVKIPDISANKSEVEKLVSLCNELQLDPIHLEDIVEDFLYTLSV